ncbi:phenylalanine racemase (ATP-hydrolyzing) [Streptococcus sanguinis ATCC 29667]|uniref:Putative non-ribosomal peptide sythetase n=2 Tax=Streptococcus sanguinis TaxID=1305 RepID=A0A2X3VHC2_STRSA|nr:hybrid non-ribosomal peptide synthetase/type I polyketide synthase [Streptococcus sanguinis]EGQ21624.1 phenylalanine racemase (ATP-hydrolyzing) [Streptococcus sanguinis ATCC 29667]SQF35139.1 putative non-ribosomal peptide sythetase [Streptococcus sanguinis]
MMELRDLLFKISNYLNIPSEKIDLDRPFIEMGFDSQTLVQFVGELERELNVKLDMSALIDYPTVNKFHKYMNEHIEKEKVSVLGRNNAKKEKIAITGMACKFPGANDIDEFFKNLKNHVLSVKPYPEKRKKLCPGVSPKENKNIYDGGYIDDIEEFDNIYFNMPETEAINIDPQQRILLQEVVHALEDADITEKDIQNTKIGVFVGASNTDYLRSVISNEKDISAVVGNSMAMLSNRISYFFDFKGPSMTIDTACSSSLVAVSEAIESINRGECEAAVVAGVNVILDAELNKAMGEAGMLSPDGLCQTFDEKANGYVRGEGVGVLFLKRLIDAENRGDRIYASIIGKAINQDGRSASLTAPNKIMQVELLKRSAADAGLLTSEIRYIETHGTGTFLGDYIEVSAIDEAINQDLRRKHPLLLGAVKTNIGHLESAAGVASLIKTALCLFHSELVPTRNVDKINKKLELEQKNIHIVQDSVKINDKEFICSVSSFGFGGTNCNVVLEKYNGTVIRQKCNDKNNYIIPLSDVSQDALYRKIKNFRHFVQNYNGSLNDVEYTLAQRVNLRKYRIGYVIENKEDLLKKLDKTLKVFKRDDEIKNHNRVALLFSGQGTQWLGMGRQLSQFPAYQEMFEKCVEKFKTIGQCDLNEIINSDREDILQDSYFAQPAIFAIQVSIAHLFKEMGIHYDLVCGHSLGEVAAAFTCGALSLNAAVKIIHTRSTILRQFTGKGRMLSVSLSEEEASEYLKVYKNTSIGVVNTYNSVVISGANDEVKALEEKFRVDNVRCQYLPVNYAFHYVGLESFKEEFIEKAGKIKSKPTNIEFVSTVTGGTFHSKELDANYWANNMRNTVRFADAAAYIADKSDIIIEIAPSSTLMFYLLDYQKFGVNLVTAQQRGLSPDKALLNAAVALFDLGIDIHWHALNIKKGNRIYLPKYSFAKNKIWPKVKEKTTSPEISTVQKSFTQDEVEAFVIDLMSSVTYEPVTVTPESEIADLDIDSLKLFQLNSKINTQFDIELKVTDLSRLETVGDLILKIDSYLQENRNTQNTATVLDTDIKELVTDGQAAIIRDQLLNKTSNKYNMAAAWKMGEEFDAKKWKLACETVIRNHIILNLRFSVNGQQIVQTESKSSFEVQITDFSRIDDIDGYINKVLNQPFDLEKETVRVILGSTINDWYFGLSIHHSVIDGVSIFFLLKEIIVAYKQLQSGNPLISQKDESYFDYQKHELSIKESDQYKVAEDKLEKVLDGCDLAEDFAIFSNPDRTKSSSLEKYLQINNKLFKKLKDFSKEYGYTLFETLYSIYQLLYYKINNDNNFITCTYSSGRENATYYDTIGYLVKNILISSRIDPQETANNFIKKVHEKLFEVYDYPAGISLNYLKNIGLGTGKNLSHVFVYEKTIGEISGAPVFMNSNEKEKAFTLDGMNFEKVSMECVDAQYNLVFMLEECSDKVIVRCQFKEAVYEDRAIEVLLDSYETLLENILTDAELPIKDYGISKNVPTIETSFEMQGIKYHQYLEYFAEKLPEKLAVSYDEENISYAELNRRSNVLAKQLIQHTQGENIAVGVAVEKTQAFLTSIFAVMKAGAYYVPLDKNYPRERLQYIMDNSGMKFLVSDGTFEDMGLDYSKVTIVSPVITDKVSSNLAIDNGLASTAYMIYTSGTTGKPKGVKVTHSGIENVVKEQGRLFNVNSNDRITFFASVCFDASVFDILMAIGHGGTLVFSSREKMGTGVRLHDFLKDKEITITTLPSSVLASMENENLPNLRVIVTAGEPCTDDIKNNWCTDHEFYNAYGVTEATIWNTTSKCNVNKKVMIGKPVANTDLRIVNQDGNLCPEGITGELLIGGISLAKGYAGLKELNQKRFIYIEGNRFYRTGDLVRLDYSGELDYVARADNQVKIHGYRVELEEIEKVIQKLSKVKNAIVLLIQKGNDKQLVSYIEPRPQENLSEQNLRNDLGPILPHYMIPDRVFLTEYMPLTQNGKIDRERLKQQALEEIQSRTIILPTTSKEAAVVAVLQKYVENDEISMTDTLLELGIDSINIYNLMVDIEKEFGVALKIEELLKNISVSALCQSIYDENNQSNLILQKKPQDVPIRLSEKQKGIWVASQLKKETREYNIPIALKLTGVLNRSALNKALNKIVERHNILHTKYYRFGDDISCDLDDNFAFEIPVEDISKLTTEQKHLKIQTETTAMKLVNLKPDKYPLFKVKLLQAADDEHYFLFTIHHFIADGWSFKIIFTELKHYYNLYHNGTNFEEEPLEYQYEDIGYTEYIKHDEKRDKKRETYWKNKFENDKSILSMPEDYPRPPVMDHAGRNVYTTINSKKYAEVGRFVQQHGITVFSFMTAILGILLRRYSGQESINIGFPILGRDNKYSQKMVGMFIDTTVAKLNVDPNLSFKEYLNVVANEIISSMDMGEIGLNRIVEAANPPRSSDNTQLFQVLINMIDFNVDVNGLDGLALDVMEDDVQEAKYDFTFYLTENTDGLQIRLNYYSSVYSQETAQLILNQYVWLIEMIIQDASRRVGEYRLAKKIDFSKGIMAKNYNDLTSLAYKALENITNNNKNLNFEYRNKTYHVRDIQKQVAQIFEELKSMNVPKGCVIAISGLREPCMVAAILAVLKYKSLFTIVDSQWPKGKIKDALKATNSSYFIDLTDNATKILEVQSQKVHYSLDDSSYVAMTSGTTGKPKTILGSNSAVNHFINWEIHHFGLNSNDRFAVLSGISHDPILRDIFVPLTLGASLVFPNESELVQNDLFEYLKQSNISVANITPSLAEAIILGAKRHPNKKLEHLRFLFFGGERLRKTTVQALKKIAPNCRIVNYYGTTETPQGMSFIEYNEEALNSLGEYLPIGSGIDGVKIVLTDESGEEVSIGEIGTVHVCTKYLAKGYLTADSDQIIPVSSQTNDYNTGDLGRYRLDGTIDILGRKDRQIKRYGQRIELGEIESIVARYDGIDYAKALFYKDNIYVFVTTAVKEFDEEKCKYKLFEYLPAYMMPSRVLVIPSIPLTRNGKIDDRWLEKLVDNISISVSDNQVLSETEKRVKTAWEEVLELHTIPFDKTFFEVGGTSMKLLTLQQILEEQFRREIPMTVLFNHPTIRTLSKYLDKDKSQPENNIQTVLEKAQQRRQKASLFMKNDAKKK